MGPCIYNMIDVTALEARREKRAGLWGREFLTHQNRKSDVGCETGKPTHSTSTFTRDKDNFQEKHLKGFFSWNYVQRRNKSSGKDYDF